MYMVEVRWTVVGTFAFIVNYGQNLDQRPVSNVQTLARLLTPGY